MSKNTRFSVTEAAEILKVSPDTLRRLEKRKVLEPERGTSNERLYSPRDVALLREILNPEKEYTIREVSKIMGVTPHTIRRWEKEGKVEPSRTPGGHRRFTKKQIDKLRRDKSKVFKETTTAPDPNFYLNLKLIGFLVLSSILLLVATTSEVTKAPFLPGKTPKNIEETVEVGFTDILHSTGGTYIGDARLEGNLSLTGSATFEKGAQFGKSTLTIDENGSLVTNQDITSSSLSVTNNASIGSITIAGNKIINDSGKIPAISSTYFASLDGSNLTDISAKNLDGTEKSSFLRADESDTAGAVITFTASPGNTGVDDGPLYINPSSTTANYTLFGVAVGGTQKFKVDAEGDVSVAGGLSLFENSVSDGTIEATEFCTGDGETNCVTDFSSLGGGGGSTAFSDITTGTNTSATMTVGSGATLTFSGSGTITASDVSANSVTLSTDTTGDYVGTITAGDGLDSTGATSGEGIDHTLSVNTGSGIQISSDAVALGTLTADYSQTGAFDFILDNADSQIQILESVGGTFYATLDVGDLSGNATYTLSGSSGTLLTSTNYTGTLNSVYVNVGESPSSGDISGSFSGGLTLDSNTVDDNELVNTLSYTGTLTLSQTFTAEGDINFADTGADTITLGDVNDTTSITGANWSVTSGGKATFASDLDVDGTSNDIAGTINLSGNSLTSSGDLTIDPGGGGVKIGTGTPGSVDLAGDDFYVTADLEVDGTIYGDASNLSNVTASDVSCSDCVALTSETSGNYVTSVTNGTGITGGDGGSEGAALTLSVDETNSFSWTADHTFTLAETEDLAIDISISGSNSGQGQIITLTNSSSSGNQYGLYLDNAASSGTTESLLAIDNSDNDTAVTSAIQIIDAGGGFTNLIDNAGTLISSAELNRLDGKDASLVDANDAVTTALTGTGALDSGSITSNFGSIDVGTDAITSTGTVTAGTLSVNAESFTDLTGNGLELSSGSLSLLLDTSAADGSTTSSVSGLEFISGELSLIRGCGAGQILEWDDVNFDWQCADDDSGGGGVWTANSNVLHPTSTDDQVVIGGQTNTDFFFEVKGARTGKALVALDETGDQNILTASASGTTIANLDRSGNLEIEGQLSDLSGSILTINDELQINGDLIKDSGGSERIEFNTGLSAIRLTASDVNLQGADLAVGGGDITSSGDLNLNPGGGDLTVQTRMTVGSSSPGVGKLTATGAEVGKALVILDETGDQNILTASASGSTKLNLTNGGQLELSTDGSTAGITIGAGEDLALYHNSTDSFITNATNNLFLAADDDSANSQLQFGLEDASTVLGYFITGTASQGDFAVDTDTLYVDASANELGINVSNPRSTLHVNKDGNNAVELRISNDETTQANGLLFGFENDETAFINNIQNTDFYISTNSTERLRIDSVGIVGINTSTADQGQLEVKGGTVCVDTDSDDNATSCIASESDARLKDSVVSIDGALDKLLSIRGVEFDWKVNDQEIIDKYPLITRYKDRPHSIGVIGQEIEAVFPEAMLEETRGGFKQVNYGLLIAPTIEAIRELNTKVESLKIDSNGELVINNENKEEEALSPPQELEGKISSLESNLSSIQATSSSNAKRIDNLETELTLLDSKSFNLQGSATDSGKLALDNATISSITVVEDAVLGDTVVNGTLNVGGLSFDNLTGEVNAVGPLRLQSLALDSIEFVGNTIEMDKSGNLHIKKGIIAGNDKLRGSEVLASGETSIRVEKDWDSSPVSITVTPSYNSGVWITNRTESGFTINVSKAPAEDAKVDWFAIW